MQRGNSFLRILVYSTLRPKFKTYILISNSVGAKISRWHLGINSFGTNSDIRRNCTLHKNCPAGAKISRWHLGINSFGANSDIRRNFTLRRNCPTGTSEFTYFWRQLGSPLGMKIPGDSLLGVPVYFRWRLGINSFWRELGYLLGFSRWHLQINTVWRQIGSPLGLSISGDSFLGIPPYISPLGFTLLICLWETTCSPVGGLLFLSFLGELHLGPYTI